MISIVCPVYNKASTIGAFGRALAGQHTDEQVEIIFVVRTSSDNSRREIDRLHLPFPIKTLDADACNSAASQRNIGARVAKGDSLVFLDPDIVFASTFLSEFLRELAGDPRRVVLARAYGSSLSGSVYPYFARTPVPSFATPPGDLLRLAEQSRALHDLRGPLVDDSGGLGCLPAPWVFCWSLALALNASLFHEVGGFDESLSDSGSEDLEFGYRLFEAGAGFTLGSSLAVFHLPHSRDRDRQERLDRLHERYLLQKHTNWHVEALVAFGPENANHMLGVLKHFSALAADADIAAIRESARGIGEVLPGSLDLLIGMPRPELGEIRAQVAVFPSAEACLPLYGFALPFSDTSRGRVLLTGLWLAFPERLSALVLNEACRVSAEVYVLQPHRILPMLTANGEDLTIGCHDQPYWERTFPRSRWWYDFPLEQVGETTDATLYRVTPSKPQRALCR